MAKSVQTSRSKVKAPKAAKKEKKPARVAPQVISDAIGGNITDSAIRDGLKEAVELQDAMKSASSAFANHKKKLKAMGIYPDDVSWYLSARQREVDDIDAETRRRNRIATIMRLPLGTQLGLFDSGSGKDKKGKTVATVVENEQGVAERSVAAADTKRQIATKEAMDNAMAAGELAGREGHLRDGNPHVEGSPEAIRWDVGWLAGDRARNDADFAEVE